MNHASRLRHAWAAAYFRHGLTAAVLVSLSGCLATGLNVTAGNTTTPSPGGSQAGSPPARPAPNRPVRFQSPVPIAAVRPCTRAESPYSSRNPAAVQTLFKQREVSGTELIAELATLRTLGSRGSGSARQLAGCSPLLAQPSQGNNGKIDWGGVLKNVAGSLSESMLEKYTEGGTADGSASAFSPGAMTAHLDKLLGDTQLLSQEKVKLPEAAQLTLDEQKRMLTMAALVVGARVSGKLLTRAKSDFDNLETEYTGLIDRREKAATLLFDVLQKRQRTKETQQELAARRGSGGPDLASVLNKEDLAALDRLPANMTLGEFANDFTAQNVAMQWIRRTDPEAYKSYRASADGLVGRTRAYVRSITGVAAFGGMVALFAREVVAMNKNRKPAEIIASAPFAYEFLKETWPLVQISADVAMQGVVVQPAKVIAPKRFRVTQEGSAPVEVADAEEVYKLLAERQVTPLMTGAFFRSDAPGLLQRLYQCDAVETSRMIDATLTASERSQFAAGYLRRPDGDTFTFTQMARDSTGTNFSRQERDSLSQLLRRDHRQTTDDSTLVLGKIQSRITEGYANWNDEQLMRLIFANRDGRAAQAALQLGDVTIKPVPSMQSIYVYEATVDTCRNAATAGHAPEGAPRLALLD